LISLPLFVEDVEIVAMRVVLEASRTNKASESIRRRMSV
jgi:hypothetical protein